MFFNELVKPTSEKSNVPPKMTQRAYCNMNYVLITAHGFNSDMAPAEPIVAIDPTISMKTPQLQDISCRGIS